MDKKNHLLLNGIILAAVFVFLTVRFIMSGFMAVHILILIVVLLLFVFQLYLYFKFFGKNKKND